MREHLLKARYRSRFIDWDQQRAKDAVVHGGWPGDPQPEQVLHEVGVPCYTCGELLHRTDGHTWGPATQDDRADVWYFVLVHPQEPDAAGSSG